MTEKQPKALECAEDLAGFMRYLERIWGDDYAEFRTLTESEKELRRLHEVNLELLEALKLAANALDKMGDMPYSDVSTHAWFSLDCEKIVEDSKSLIAKSTGQSK